MEGCLGLPSSFVCLATFLYLSILVVTSGGQPQPQVLLVTQPEQHYYVTKDHPAKVTCEAYGATSITFMCLGSPVPVRALTTFRTYDEARDTTLVASTLTLSWQEVRRAEEAGVREYWCQCTAQNEARFISVSSRRTVVSRAFLEKNFVESPVSQIVSPGSNVILTCTPPLGDPAPQVTWRKDGHKVKTSRDDNLVLGADNSLTIISARTRDTGNYHCAAKNMAGRRQSSPATLVVEDPEEEMLMNQLLTTRVHKDTPRPRAPRNVQKPVFLEQPPPVSIITTNEPLTLICDVEGAAQLTIRCNNQRFKQEDMKSLSAQGDPNIRKSVTIHYAEVQQYMTRYEETRYECECVAWYQDPSLPRKWGSVPSLPTSQIVLAYLDEEFEAAPSDVTAQLGTSASMTCVPPKGQPQPTVVWMFEAQRVDVEFDRRFTVDGNTLTINNLRDSDEGRYYCIAQNLMGNRQSGVGFLRVSVDPVPEPTSPPPETTPVDVRGMGEGGGSGGLPLPTFPPVIPSTPFFTRDLKESYYLDERGEANLTCTVVSADSLTFTCMSRRLSEGEQVVDMQTDRESGKRLLTASTTVSQAQLVAEGERAYTCHCEAWYIVDRNKWLHNVSRTATIHPAYIDSVFVYEPQGGLFYLGDTAELACEPPGGQPIPKVMWIKDGNILNIEADENLEMMAEGTLIIRRVRVQDEGEYRCAAYNAAGRRQSSPAVLETRPISTDTTPKMTVVTDNTTPLSTTISDMDIVTMSTSKNGAIIPIFVTDDFKAVDYIVGQMPLSLRCTTMEGTRLQFLCNGKEMEIDKKNFFTFTDEVSDIKFLELIHIITRKDVEEFSGPGDYACRCRVIFIDGADGVRFIEDDDTVIKLAYLEDEFVQQPVQQSVTTGLSTELLCQPPMGDPEPSVVWYKDNRILQPTDTINVSEEGNLVFYQVALSDSGNYTCVAHNIMGRKISQTVPLTVTEPGPDPQTPRPTPGDLVPEFLTQPDSIYYIIKSKAVTITCKTIGPQQISFKCNGENLRQSRVDYRRDDSAGDQEVMMASIEVSREEVENYNNQRGNDDFNCQCYIRYTDPDLDEPQSIVSTPGYVEVAYLKKMFPREPSDLTLNEGEFLSIPCDAPEGNPTPKVQWMKDGEPIEPQVPAPNNAFIIQSVTEEDVGVYVCVVSNIANERKSKPGAVSVIVNGVPVTPVMTSPTTDPSFSSTTTEYETTQSPVARCMALMQHCTAMVDRGGSFPKKLDCKNVPRASECLDEFLSGCQGIVQNETLRSVEDAKQKMESSCPKPTKGVCQEVLECQSRYSQHSGSVSDAEEMPIGVLCQGIHGFLSCAEDAARTCNIPPDNPDMSLGDLADWFEDYCEKVVEQDWASECRQLSKCNVPVQQITVLSNLVQASLWCPHVKEMMECTNKAARDCGVQGMQQNLTHLENKAQMTCLSSAGNPDGNKENNDGGDNMNGGRDSDSIGQSQSEGDGNPGGNAHTVRASVLVTSLLPVVLALTRWR